MTLPPILAKIFSGNPIKDIGSIIDNVVTTKAEKEQLRIELEKLNQQHLQTMATLEAEVTKAYLADVDSARNREIETTKAGSGNMVQAILAMVSVTFFFMIAGYVIVTGLSDMDENEAFLIGNLFSLSGSLAMVVMNYYFGSSAGSAQKDLTIKKLQK